MTLALRPAFANRILPDGGFITGVRNDIRRLDANGNVVRTYDVDGEDGWFALNLDPDGTSFWSGNQGNGHIYKIDFESGDFLQFIDTRAGLNSNDEFAGLSIFGEPRASQAFEIISFRCNGSSSNPYRIGILCKSRFPDLL